MADFSIYLKSIFDEWFSGYWFLTALPETLTWIMPAESIQQVTAGLDRLVSPEMRQRCYRILFIVGFFVAGFFAWTDEHHRVQTQQQRSAIREQLGAFLAQSESMQRQCVDNNAPLPDVTQWKVNVEKYLETLGHSYVVRFQEGVTNLGPAGADQAHQSCWSDLHVREENLERFFQDFPSFGE